MTQDLFRKAAVEHAKGGIEGCIVVRQPVVTRFIALPILASFVCALWFLAHMDYAHKVTVSGYLSFKKGLVAILSPDSATITKVLIAEGQWVQKDTPLVELTRRLILVNRSDKNALHRQNLMEEIALLGKQTQAEANALKVSIAKSVARAGNLRALLLGQQSRLRLKVRHQEMTARQLHTAIRLSQVGVLSHADRQKVESAHLLEAEQVLGAKIALNRLAGEHTDQLMVTTELRGQLESKSYQAKAAAVRLQTRVLELDSLDSLVTAPVAGRVSGMTALVGTRVQNGQPLLSLLDESAELEAILFVPPRGSSQITIGQQVGLRYAGFPYQKFGSQKGRVTEVGRSLVLKGSSEKPLITTEPVYKVRVKPHKRSIAAYGQQLALTSGMLLEADLVHDIRPLWMWLFDPVLSMRGRS